MVQTHIVINIQYVPTLSLLFSFTGCIFIAISRERGASQGSRSTQVRPWRILCERALAAGIDFLTYDPPQKRREFFAAACRNINFFTPRQGRGPLWTLADADRHMRECYLYIIYVIYIIYNYIYIYVFSELVVRVKDIQKACNNIFYSL